MLVFIDESGDPGMKLGKSSSQLFTVSLILFVDPEEAARAERRIAELRGELGFRSDFEFHFSKLREDYRQAFLRAVAAFDFHYFAATINKPALDGRTLCNPVEMFRFACELAFINAKPFLEKATVIVDGSGTPTFERELSSDLRKRVNGVEGERYIRKVKLQDSDRNTLLQMADVVCGAVARCHTARSDAESYRAIIAHREGARHLWPH